MRSFRHHSLSLLALILAVAPAFARPAPIIPIEAVPEDMPPEVRKHVLRLYGPDNEDCKQAVSALRALGPAAAPAAPFLAGILHDEVRHGETSGMAVDALISIGKPSIEPILIMFQFGGAYARMRGLKVLNALKDERGIPALVMMVADNPGAPANGIMDILRSYGQPAIDYLKEGLRNEDPTTRRNCVYALPAFATTNTVQLLTGVLSDADIQVRTAARESLLTAVQRDPALLFPASDAVIQSLKDSDPLSRRLAIRVLMRTTDDRKVERVAAMANDTDPGVQQEVIKTLSEVSGTNVEQTLLGLVKSRDPAVSAAAMDVLANRGSTNVIPVLVGLLASPDPTVREGAVSKIGAYHTTNTLGILLPVVRDQDPLVRMRAVSAFAEVRDPRVIDALKAATTDRDGGVRLEAVRSLSAYYLGSVAVGHNLRRNLPATAEMPLYSPAVQGGLIGALRDKNVRVRELALYALTENGAPLLPTNVLLAVLNDQEAYLRSHALGQLGRFREVTPLDPIRSCLKDSDERVRADAIRVLGRLRDQASFSAIVAAATGGREEARSSVEVLGNFGEEAIPVLSKALQHSDEQVRERAAGSLASMKTPKADAALRSAAKDERPKTREAAAHGLRGQSQSARTPEVLVNLLIQSPSARENQGIRAELVRMGSQAVPVLLPLLSGTNAVVRLMTASMLGEIGTTAVVAPLGNLLADADPIVRTGAIESLARTHLTNAVAPVIRNVLNDSVPSVRESAAVALGQLRDPESIPGLSCVLLQDPDWQVRAAAAEGLAQIRNPQAIKPLASAATSDPNWAVRRAAANGLGQLKSAESVPALVKLLSDEHWSVRRAATDSLSNITGQVLGPDKKAWDDWMARSTDRGRSTNAPSDQ